MAFRILKFYTSACSRGQLLSLQEETSQVVGDKYQGTTSGSSLLYLNTQHRRQNIQCLIYSSALQCAFGKQPLKIQEMGYKAEGILGLPWLRYYCFTMLLKREACQEDRCVYSGLKYFFWYKINYTFINQPSFDIPHQLVTNL